METAEIINAVCSELGTAKAELAKRMGIHPSSLSNPDQYSHSITEETLNQIYHMIKDIYFLEMLNSEQYQIISVHFEKFRMETIEIKEKNEKRIKVGKLKL